MKTMHLGTQLFTARDHMKTPEDFKATMRKVADIGYNCVQVSGVNWNVILPEIVAEASKETGLKVVLTQTTADRLLAEPDKALTILKRMQKDIQEVYDRTKAIDIKLGDLPTTSTVVNDAALAYKEELMRKKRERERNDQNTAEIVTAETNTTETNTEEV